MNRSPTVPVQPLLSIRMAPVHSPICLPLHDDGPLTEEYGQ